MNETQKVKVNKKMMLREQIPVPEIPADWDFNKADKDFDKRIFNWRRLTGDVMSELWIFYNKLKVGHRRKSVANATQLPTWEDWIASKGIDRTTAYRHFKALGWLIEIKESSEDEWPWEGEGFKLISGDFREIEESELPNNTAEWLITDPPYGREFLDLWEGLADFAVDKLKDNGSLIAMSGQSYLPEVYANLLNNEELTYYWTSAYLTPGQAPKLRQKQVNTQWKPLVWAVKGNYAGDTVSDVIHSPKRDKEYHKWGQSVGGMEELIKCLTKENDVIVDPMVGGGSVAIAAVKLNRRFIGIDIDEEAIIKTSKRLSELENDTTKTQLE